MFLFSPGDKSGAAAGLENAETFAESLAEIGKKHDAKAAGEGVEGSVGERKGFGVGFAEIDVGEAFLTGEFFGERHHAGAEVRGGDAAGRSDFAGDGERGIADATREVENAHARTKLRGFEDGFGCAAGKGSDLRVPFAPGGDGPVAGPLLVKMLAELLDFCRIRRAHD